MNKNLKDWKVLEEKNYDRYGVRILRRDSRRFFYLLHTVYTVYKQAGRFLTFIYNKNFLHLLQSDDRLFSYWFVLPQKSYIKF